ncbi:MAG TPA: CopD family protein [Gammaproteobacteria bacterium]|nr:CopD family protein [Gammaproteobacteria bacterium]
MSALALALHVLAAIVWVGGMFFAYLAVRPALGELDTKHRARIWAAIFRRFFPWVWACIAALLASGFYLAIISFDSLSQAPIFVHVMMGLGIVMMALFAYVFLVPYQQLKTAVQTGSEPLAIHAMVRIRLLIATNLTLGIVVVLVGMLGSYFAF